MATPSRQLERATTEEQVLGIVRELLTELGSEQAAQNVTLDSSLERDLGLGSMERVELLVRCEARFYTRLPDEVAQEAETLVDWVRALVEGGEKRPSTLRHRIEQPTREAPAPPAAARNLMEVLRRQAEIEPDRVHIHLIEDEWVHDITFGELLTAASEVAAGLQAGGLRRNDAVAIMLPTCAEFYQAFLGVMLAGGVAVPIYPPARPDKIEEYVRRQNLILRSAEARFLISFDRVKSISKLIRIAIPSLVEPTTVGALRQRGASSPKVPLEPAETAFIQYTSGSTGDPKGVVLSHANILANIQGIGWAVQVRPTDVGVSWLPLYHDMGLIGSWLFCLFYAVPLTMMSPLAFLSRPERWLWALHDSRGTLCPAPNFSYELCARKIHDDVLEGLDLSPWRVAINAGEAVLPDTLARFAERFRPYGFRAQSFVPCYGLAESSVALAFPPLHREPAIDTIEREPFEQEGRAVPAEPGEPNVIRLVANGRPLPGHEIRLVDDQDQIVDERMQGRLFFRGPSMTSGYFRNPQATAALVTQDGWMDSGDLAYWANGEIYVTGRLKDCIIKAGRNIIPQEVETATAEVAGVRRGCVAAFGTVDPQTGTERLVIAAETRATSSEQVRRIEGEIVRQVDAVLGIPPDKVILVRPHIIPKTSSGKIRRNETRSLYLNGKLEAARKPPWLQIFRLWFEHLGSSMRLAVKNLAARLRGAYTSMILRTISAVAGALARLVPGRKPAVKAVQAAARGILALAGKKPWVQGADGLSTGPGVVFIANRAGSLDLLVLAAALPSHLLVAEGASLAAAPSAVRFLLRPLVAPPVNGEALPPGGTVRERIRQGLESGHSVVVFAENPTSVPAPLVRFRLDALQAAAALRRQVIPVLVTGTAGLLAGHTSSPPEGVRVRVGKAILPTSTEHSELIQLRENIREAMGKLCG